MNIYRICEIQSNECTDSLHNDYLTHENELTEEGFIKICEEGLLAIQNKSLYCLKKYLTEQKGFKRLIIKGSFEFGSTY